MDFDSVMWLCLSIPVIHVIVFITMPETPVFLVKQGNVEVSNIIILLIELNLVFRR